MTVLTRGVSRFIPSSIQQGRNHFEKPRSLPRNGETPTPNESNKFTFRKSQILALSPSPAKYSVNATEGHDLLYGRNVVISALTANKRKFWRLLVWNPDSVVLKLASLKNIKIVNVENKGILNNLSNNRPHNGYILEASPVYLKQVTSLGPVSDRYTLHFEGDECATFEKPKTRYPLWVWLDRITDPENMGSIIRTSSFLGVQGILVSSKNSAGLNPVVAKASSGALESASLFSVASGARFIKASLGWKFIAAHMSGSTKASDICKMIKKDPCVLVLGSEGDGISLDIIRNCHHTVSVDGFPSDTVDSLNVGVAAGILVSRICE